MKLFLKRIIYLIINRLLYYHKSYQQELIYKNFKIDRTVRFWNISLEGNIKIDKYTYLNDHCRIDTGEKSKVIIGSHCAIGRRVHITSKTHSMIRPTTTNEHPTILHEEKDTIIGDGVWIGDGALINKGIRIGDNAIIGANAVVIKDVKPFEIVGGVPARHIRFNYKHHKYLE